tara:strand:- start:182 stop:454 length:273 start_codon:yes stop_codon:yes gene_type:complete
LSQFDGSVEVFTSKNRKHEGHGERPFCLVSEQGPAEVRVEKSELVIARHLRNVDVRPKSIRRPVFQRLIVLRRFVGWRTRHVALKLAMWS